MTRFCFFLVFWLFFFAPIKFTSRSSLVNLSARVLGKIKRADKEACAFISVSGRPTQESNLVPLDAQLSCTRLVSNPKGPHDVSIW